ncbi:hypothetical protein CVIRNUC_006428 [Coccomyxa viridis]|uniref:Uncharacterized protein n=1 Tax=Coccomyxa viridis TaxID=1274662 RepID=A0AAV1IBC3_9CHLO|nr:hypothetical protein CVIRNUC_006428 [Coccomyxa viridis]
MSPHRALLSAFLVALVANAAAQENNRGSNGGNNGGNRDEGHDGNRGHGRHNGNGKAGGRGDPIMTGFDGRSFEIIGQAGAIYSLISEKHHKVSTKLKVGVMWDHNGTYMEGFGFQYRNQRVQVELTPTNELAVTMNGELLTMTKGETELEMVPYVPAGELLVLWQLHREGLGNTVEITTDLLQLTVWLTPAGTVDEGGVEQPAYLNFDAALLGRPSNNEMEGIIGETYNRMLVGADALSDPASPAYLPDDMQFYGQGAEATYAVAAYFGEGATSVSGKERRRVLIESNMHSAFPVHAMGRGGKLEPARRPIVQHASGGRKGRFL